MPKDAPNFAMLIGKPSGDSPDHAKDLGLKDDGMDQSGAEDSAAKDLIAAVKSGDVGSFKSALKDFLEICYPSLSDEQSESSEEKQAEGDEGSPDSGY